jgi:acetyl esterase/lipase
MQQSQQSKPPMPAPASASPAAVRLSDVRYAPVSPAQVLDLVVPAGDGPFPLVIKIHGGAFLAGDKASELDDVDLLNAAGYAVASLNYRLSCEALFPAAVQDVKAAVRYLRAHAGEHRLDPDRFAAWGESAGANLAAMVGATGSLSTFLDDESLGSPHVSSEVAAVVGWYGPYDFNAMDSDFEKGRPAACPEVQPHDVADSPESLYLGAPLPTVRDLAAAAGPGRYLAAAPRLPPFLLVAGDSDCLVPHQQSGTLHQGLLQVGARSSYTLLPGATHGDPVFRATQTRPAVAFLDVVLGR